MGLCNEYKAQLIRINELLKLKKQINDSLPQKNKELVKEISNLNYYKSNLEYSIAYMERCHPPGVYSGIESTKASKVY